MSNIIKAAGHGIASGFKLESERRATWAGLAETALTPPAESLVRSGARIVVTSVREARVYAAQVNEARALLTPETLHIVKDAPKHEAEATGPKHRKSA